MQDSFAKKRVAIVADWLTNRGGAEHIVEALAETFPEADIFTMVYVPEHFPKLKGRTVFTSWLQRLPSFLRQKHQILSLLFPRIFERFDMSGYDIIISSSSSGFSKLVRKVVVGQVHICYCHTPVRYLYHAREHYLKHYRVGLLLRPLKVFLPQRLKTLAALDRSAAQNVDVFVANSDFVGQRIQRYYGRSSKTIYPGIALEKFLAKQGGERSSFLALGRMIPYKKFDLLIEAFAERPDLSLKLAGQGPELSSLKALAKKLQAENVKFLGFVKEEDLPSLYAGAKAFLFPGEEDFGITPVEAMASGCPVLYYPKGGAVESVGEKGIAFPEQTKESLLQAIDSFLAGEKSFTEEVLRTQAQKFSKQRFQDDIRVLVRELSASQVE